MPKAGVGTRSMDMVSGGDEDIDRDRDGDDEDDPILAESWKGDWHRLCNNPTSFQAPSTPRSSPPSTSPPTPSSPPSPSHQGSTNYGILPTQMGENGVSLENIEKIENVEKMENINQMTHNTKLMVKPSNCD